jgi:hypothetical protein
MRAIANSLQEFDARATSKHYTTAYKVRRNLARIRSRQRSETVDVR